MAKLQIHDIAIAGKIDITFRLGEGWDPANMFNPATLFIYVPVPSQEPVIQCLSFVYVLHMCFSFIFLHK